MTSSRFRIVIAGLVEPGFCDGFVGVNQIDEGANTVLEGPFIDQSHLNGLLDQLRNLGEGLHQDDLPEARRQIA